MAVADLGNGHPDIVTANAGDNTVSVLLGNGDGTFQPAQSFAVGIVPDVGGGGGLQRRWPPRHRHRQLWRQHGVGVAGQWRRHLPARPVLCRGQWAGSVAVADLNGDGQLDIVTANEGTTRCRCCWAMATAPSSRPVLCRRAVIRVAVAVADLDGNGQPDIVTANDGDNTVSVLLGNGDGTFQPAQPLPWAVSRMRWRWRTWAMATSTSSPPTSGDNTVSVLLGNGDGTFQPAQSIAVGSGPNAVAVADVNGDGQPDIVTANCGANTVSVLLGNGDGTFQPASPLPWAVSPFSVAVADLRRWPARHRHRQLQRQHGVGVAGQWRRHLPAGPVLGRGQRAAFGGGGGPGQWPPRHRHRQLRRQHGVGVAGQRRRHLPAGPVLCRGQCSRIRWRWRTSTAMADPTSSPPTTATTRCRCCWAMATAPSSPPSPSPWGVRRCRWRWRTQRRWPPRHRHRQRRRQHGVGVAGQWRRHLPAGPVLCRG